jgi:hypothetical protein
MQIKQKSKAEHSNVQCDYRSSSLRSSAVPFFKLPAIYSANNRTESEEKCFFVVQTERQTLVMGMNKRQLDELEM